MGGCDIGYSYKDTRLLYCGAHERLGIRLRTYLSPPPPPSLSAFPSKSKSVPTDRRILADRRPTTDRPIATRAHLVPRPSIRIRVPALSRLAVGEQRPLYPASVAVALGRARTRTCTLTCAYGLNTDALSLSPSSAPYHSRNGREMEAHLVQTRGRAPAGPFVSPTATSTSTSTSAISPLPPPSRPLPSLPSSSPPQPHSQPQPQTHAQPRPSDETFTDAASTRTDVRSSVQTQTQFTSDRVSVPILVSEIACTSEEGGGKKTKSKKEKAPKVKKAKEVQKKVKVKQPRFVSVPISRVPCPSLHFTSGHSSLLVMSVPTVL